MKFVIFFCLGLISYGYPAAEFAVLNSQEPFIPKYLVEPGRSETVKNADTTAYDFAPDYYSSESTKSNADELEIITPPPATTESLNVVEIDAIQNMISEFAKFTTIEFNTSRILDRIGKMELNIQNRTTKLSQEINEDTLKLHQLDFVLGSITNVKTKLTELEGHMEGLTKVIDNIKIGNFTVPQRNTTDVVPQTARATLYQYVSHFGRSVDLDFRTCTKSEECCKNLGDLHDATQSVHTHDTCVILFKDKDCTGDYRQLYPGSTTNHVDFGNFKNVISSGKPC